MKRALFVINTYFQLLTAIQISRTMLKNYEIDYLVSDCSQNSKAIVERINSLEIVHKAYHIETKSLSFNSGLKTKIRNILRLINYRSESHRIVQTDFKKYDLFLFHNMDFTTYLFFAELKNNNPAIKTVRFEEGFNIYLQFNDKIKSEKLAEKIFCLLGIGSLRRNISNILLYHPELLTYDMDIQIKKIPLIDKSDNEYKKIVNTIWEYNNDDTQIPGKAIIFEECFWADGYNIKDYQLFTKIAEYMLPYKTSIKLHPRNGTDRFKNTACLTVKNSSIPWEVIQMNENFNDRVFFAITSGSILASLLYFNEKIPTVFLYKVIGKGCPMKKNYEKYLNKILQQDSNYEVYIPEDLSELKSIILKLKENNLNNQM